MSGISRSAMGKSVDMGALVSRNEKVRAVGNMNVNARGDILDSNNKIILRPPTVASLDSWLDNFTLK